MSRARPLAIVVTKIFLPEGSTSAYNLAALVRSVHDRGFEVRVVTTRPPKSTRRLPVALGEGVRISRWPVLRDRGGNVRGYVQYLSFDLPLAVRLLLTRRPAVLIAQPPPTTGVMVRIAAHLRRTPYVYYANDVMSVAAQGIGVSGWAVRLLRRIEQRAMRGAAVVLSISSDVSREIEALGVEPERIRIVGVGADTDTYCFDGPVEPGADECLVYAGTMSEVHGAEVFLHAFGGVADAHPNARLIMFGQGTDRDRLRRWAEGQEHLVGRVEFPGVVAAEEVARWMRGARAGLASVQSGRGYDFAFATKMFAATGCGAPAIFAGVGPNRDLVEANDLGWACEWDVAAVAAAMDACLRAERDDTDRARIATWTREHFSIEVVGERAADIIGELVGTAHPRQSHSHA